ncbi:hypothetical protein CDAR_390441 [Caerostris darwini]|uniref:CRESS-DNA virus Rep endonuclease domain-containing protein n=1 Tax=Caerostris darwini TaxID=1538125 RepID=A0AAV4P150_9ARAC|nr:hypothetical protein CDAR_390441 [Caerostris darwini]
MWCFTVNNTFAHDHPTLWLKNIEKYGFHCETGIMNTTRIRGWATFNKKIRLTELKNLNSKVLWEGMNGSLKQNADYCSKEEVSFEFISKKDKQLRILILACVTTFVEWALNRTVLCKMHLNWIAII